jgi:hypothetical protein
MAIPLHSSRLKTILTIVSSIICLALIVLAAVSYWATLTIQRYQLAALLGTSYSYIGLDARYGVASVSMRLDPRALDWLAPGESHWGFYIDDHPPPQFSSLWFGVAYVRYYSAVGQLPEGRWSNRVLSVPLLPLILLTGILPVLRLIHRRRQQTRRRLGLCLTCGYDLRATPERCPECGTPAPERAGMNVPQAGAVDGHAPWESR